MNSNMARLERCFIHAAARTFPPDAPPVRRASSVFTVGYAGSVHAEVLPALRTLVKVLETVGGRLSIFSQLSALNANALGLVATHVNIEPAIPSTTLIQRLRSETDALFFAMADVGLNSRICFPSKLVDYTATGLPIIVSAPEESTPAYWVREHPSAAILVGAGDTESLRCAIIALANDPERRRLLGFHAQQIGNAQFAYPRARDTFFAALTERKRHR